MIVVFNEDSLYRAYRKRSKAAASSSSHRRESLNEEQDEVDYGITNSKNRKKDVDRMVNELEETYVYFVISISTLCSHIMHLMMCVCVGWSVGLSSVVVVNSMRMRRLHSLMSAIVSSIRRHSDTSMSIHNRSNPTSRKELHSNTTPAPTRTTTIITSHQSLRHVNPPFEALPVGLSRITTLIVFSRRRCSFLWERLGQ